MVLRAVEFRYSFSRRIFYSSLPIILYLLKNENEKKGYRIDCSKKNNGHYSLKSDKQINFSNRQRYNSVKRRSELWP